MSEDRIRPGKNRILGIQLSDAAKRSAVPQNHAVTVSDPQGTCPFRLDSTIQHPRAAPEAAPMR